MTDKLRERCESWLKIWDNVEWSDASIERLTAFVTAERTAAVNEYRLSIAAEAEAAGYGVVAEAVRLDVKGEL